MTHDIRFQLFILPNAPWDELLRRFRQAEELGFDLAGTGDHFVDWTNPSTPWLEAWTLLAAVARETTRIRLATYVTQIPLRNPALLARQALTVDQISNGWLDVGLGTGLTIDPAYEMVGLPNWSGKERAARFEEYVQIVDLLLSRETSSFEGHYYQIKDAVMNPRPVQRPRPPIVIAALGPVMLRHAAKYADIWNSISFAEAFDAQLDETRDRIARIDEICATIGRDPGTLRRSYLMFDPKSRSSGGSIAYYESAEVFAEMAERLIALGITEIGLYYPILDEQRSMLEEIATEVIPRLKR